MHKMIFVNQTYKSWKLDWNQFIGDVFIPVKNDFFHVFDNLSWSYQMATASINYIVGYKLTIVWIGSIVMLSIVKMFGLSVTC